MELFKKKYIILISVALLFTGCLLFTEGQKKLHTYCPGLVIDLDSVNTSGYTNLDLSSRSVYIIGYDLGDEKVVKNYFLKNGLGYAALKDNAFFKKDDNDYKFLGDNDEAVGKTINLGKNHTVVIFDQTKHTIIIVEFLK